MPVYYVGYLSDKNTPYESEEEAEKRAIEFAFITGNRMEVLKRVSVTDPVTEVIEAVTIYDDSIRTPKYWDDRYGEDTETLDVDAWMDKLIKPYEQPPLVNQLNPLFFPTFYTLEECSVDGQRVN